MNLELETESKSEEEMADNRTVLVLIRPPTEGYGSCIVRPAVELQARFRGTSVEDPYAHLERFLFICDTFKVNGVTFDALRLRLFPFSLQGEAMEWLDDFPASQQTQTFYNGADQSVRSMLDVVANGSLFRKTPAKAWESIGNIAESNIGWPDVKNEKKAGILEVDTLTALNAKIYAFTHQMAIMQTTSANQVQAQQPKEQQVFEIDAANFMGNQGRQPYNPYSNTYNLGWNNHPNLSWKPADPTANTSKLVEQKPSFEEIMMNYVAGTETRLQNQEAMLQKLETQMAQIATQLSTRPIGTLTSNTEPNPRCVNSIMVVTRSQYEGSEQRDEEKIVERPSMEETKEETHKAEKSAATDAELCKISEDLLRNKKKLHDVTQVTLNEGCSTVLKNELSQKFQDPGSFFIPCHIGKFSVENVLCDLRSSINLMSHALAKKLVPLILGRPFLAMSRALIDVENGELFLRMNVEQVVFHMLKSPSDVPNSKFCFTINFLDVVRDFIDKNMQAQQYESINPLHNSYGSEACGSREVDQTLFKRVDESP
ncbi:uncharacterized protein [Henckelia pumila]|uniref:uncharacterized protein n=1 Tax=Henckelia pumila TaxID=405737 RepID=UPI003C6EA31C